MKRGGLLSPRLSAVIFSYTLLYVHGLLPDLGPQLDLAGTIASGVAIAGVANAASLVNGGRLVNERKTRLLLDAVPWSFSVMALALVLEGSGLTSGAGSVAVAEAGFWSLLLAFFFKNLHRLYRSNGPAR